jgi:uncharacterized protein YyaL (SSP411 family)
MSEAKFTNRLATETSPYLLQHSHNPVDWYPWNEEALARSRNEDKPILLSIGYSACHWCHVMEHESFENEEIARLMNESFVCIKVDREERPDIDSIYMNAVQMLTGHGGWPLTVFLTPELKPFHGGTYYPPVDSRGMPGFPRVLMAVADAYQNRKSQVVTSAQAITDELGKLNQFRSAAEMLTPEVFNDAYLALARNFDQAHGGFGSAPKFPPSMTLMFLLRHYTKTNLPSVLEIVELTLEKMAAGGMYDHLGGGFHRYSVDARWLVPHFEKMLYDNALLARVYLYAFQSTGRRLYRRVAEETLEYVIRDMTDRTGGFYSSEDADSEGVEGKFYVWTKEDVLSLLGADDGALFCEYYDVTEEGNFEHGTAILNTPVELEEFARHKGVQTGVLETMLARCRKALFAAREERIRPGRDDKMLTAWNALMLTAFAEAASILGRDDYRQVASRNADFILENLVRDGHVLRTYRHGQAKLNGYVEDYSYLIEGLLAVYEATFDRKYLKHAQSLADRMIEQFGDQSGEGFYFTSADHEKLITRLKDYFDNAIPSGNSVAVLSLLRLALLTNDNRYNKPAIEILRALQTAMSRYPSAFGYALCGLDFYLSEPKEIAIIGSHHSHEVRQLIEVIYSQFLPNKVVVLSEPSDQNAGDAIPLLEGRTAVGGKATAYVCRNYVCLAPASSPEELALRLKD